jgi:2-methylcitrate dehydratase PrpD
MQMRHEFMSDGAINALSALLIDIGRATLPDTAVAAAKTRLLHAIGVSLAGQTLPVAAVAAHVVEATRGPCFGFGLTHRISVEGAAFLNGVIGHASLLEDCGPGGLREGSHPGTYIFPAALAAAELANASGQRLLEGVIIGYEAVSRVGAAAPSTIVGRRFRPLGVMGALGAAAAAAHILGANEPQMAAALAIASNSAGGTTQAIFEGTMEAFFQAGYAARNGLLAAQLGQAGAQTATCVLEGPFGLFHTYGGETGDLHALVAPRDQLGICGVGIKRFAACLQNQQTIALIVDGLGKPLKAENIGHVRITRPDSGTNGLNSPGVSRSGPFDNRLSAQMSARYTAAAALLGFPIQDPWFFEAHYGDTALRDLADRIELVEASDDSVSVAISCHDETSFLFDAMDQNLLFPDFNTVKNRLLKTNHIPDTVDLPQIITNIQNLEYMSNVSNMISSQAEMR